MSSPLFWNPNGRLEFEHKIEDKALKSEYEKIEFIKKEIGIEKDQQKRNILLSLLGRELCEAGIVDAAFVKTILLEDYVIDEVVYDFMREITINERYNNLINSYTEIIIENLNIDIHNYKNRIILAMSIIDRFIGIGYNNLAETMIKCVFRMILSTGIINDDKLFSDSISQNYANTLQFIKDFDENRYSDIIKFFNKV